MVSIASSCNKRPPGDAEQERCSSSTVLGPHLYSASSADCYGGSFSPVAHRASGPDFQNGHLILLCMPLLITTDTTLPNQTSRALPDTVTTALQPSSHSQSFQNTLDVHPRHRAPRLCRIHYKSWQTCRRSSLRMGHNLSTDAQSVRTPRCLNILFRTYMDLWTLPLYFTQMAHLKNHHQQQHRMDFRPVSNKHSAERRHSESNLIRKGSS